MENPMFTPRINKGRSMPDDIIAKRKAAIIVVLSKKPKKVKVLKFPDHGMVGKKNKLGAKNSPENLARLKGATNPNAKKVKCLELNRVFNTMIDAAEFFCVGKDRISKAATKGIKIRAKYTIVYAKD